MISGQEHEVEPVLAVRTFRIHRGLGIHQVTDMLEVKDRNTYPTYPNSTDPNISNIKFPRPTMTLPATFLESTCSLYSCCGHKK